MGSPRCTYRKNHLSSHPTMTAQSQTSPSSPPLSTHNTMQHGEKFRWELVAADDAAVTAIMSSCSLSYPVARALVARGLHTPQEVFDFLRQASVECRIFIIVNGAMLSNCMFHFASLSLCISFRVLIEILDKVFSQKLHGSHFGVYAEANQMLIDKISYFFNIPEENVKAKATRLLSEP